MKGIIDGFRHTVFAFTESGTHDGYATIFQYRFYIGKVQVHRTAHSDDLCNALGCDGKGVIRFAKRIHERQVGIDLPQPFVVDHQQSIYMLGDTLYTVECLNYLLFTFKNERDSDNADGQYIHFFCNAGDDRGCTRSGSSSHTCSDEYHFRTVLQQRLDIFDALFGGIPRTVRTVTGSKTFGDITSQLQFHRYGRFCQSLIVGIAENECYVMYAFPVCG